MPARPVPKGRGPVLRCSRPVHRADRPRHFRAGVRGSPRARRSPHAEGARPSLEAHRIHPPRWSEGQGDPQRRSRVAPEGSRRVPCGPGHARRPRGSHSTLRVGDCWQPRPGRQPQAERFPQREDPRPAARRVRVENLPPPDHAQRRGRVGARAETPQHSDTRSSEVGASEATVVERLQTMSCSAPSSWGSLLNEAASRPTPRDCAEVEKRGKGSSAANVCPLYWKQEKQRGYECCGGDSRQEDHCCEDQQGGGQQPSTRLRSESPNRSCLPPRCAPPVGIEQPRECVLPQERVPGHLMTTGCSETVFGAGIRREQDQLPCGSKLSAEIDILEVESSDRQTDCGRRDERRRSMTAPLTQSTDRAAPPKRF